MSDLNPRQFGDAPPGHFENAMQRPHREHVENALWRWKGAPSEMQDAMRPSTTSPGSGREKLMRVEAQALHHEVSSAPPTSRVLYRGAATAPEGITGWSERRSVANGWARRNKGVVHTLPKGGGRGIKVADHISSQLDDVEKEWLVHEPTGYTTSPPPELKKRTRK